MTSGTASSYGPIAYYQRSFVSILIGLACLGGIICFALSTRSNGWFLGEDGVVEWASATLNAMAAALALLMLLTGSIVRSGGALMLFVALLSIACFLSEISFGARLIGFSMPAMPGGGELDGAQDFVLLAKRYFHWTAPGQWMLTLMVLLVFAAATLLVFRRFQLIRRVVAWQSGNFQRQLVLAALAALVFAVGLDTSETRHTAPIEELSELLAAGLLVAATLVDARSTNLQRQPIA